MPLHIIQDSVHRSGVDDDLQKSHWNLRLSSPAVEPVDELIDIILHVLVRHTTKGFKQKHLQIADHNVYLRQPVGRLFVWCHSRVMLMAFDDHQQSCERIGLDNSMSA